MPDNQITTYRVKNQVTDARGKPVFLTPKQKKFLEELAEKGDDQQAAKAANYRSLSDALESELVRQEYQKIQQAWGYEVRMNAKFASGEHMRLMEKFEDKYDDLPSAEKPKMAAVLAKMSDTALKASGKMNPMNAGGGGSVNVQINIGAEETKPVAEVEGKIIDVNVGENK